MTRSEGVGQAVVEVEVCGQEEATEQERRCCPRSPTGHRSEPDSGSQSSAPPRCTAGRAGQHLGGGEGMKQMERQREKRERKKKEG